MELIDEYQDDNEGEGMSAAENYDYYSLVNKKFTFVEEAACRGAGPELFFLEEGQGTENSHRMNSCMGTSNIISSINNKVLEN